MKIVLAADSFKESLSASQVVACMKKGFLRSQAGSDIVCLPLADGGEGTLEVLYQVLGGERRVYQTQDPLARPREADILFWPDRREALVEMAQASGMMTLSDLAPKDKSPWRSSTYGTGLLIKKALDLGARTIYVGLGGSATTDGGLGAARALGARFTGPDKEALLGRGQDLGRVRQIHLEGLDSRLKETRLVALTDVKSPFYGPKGAALVYGPQKQASPEEVIRLDQGLEHVAGLVKESLGLDLQTLTGAGAAGGLGGGLAAFLGAKLVPGADFILEMMDFSFLIEDADWLVTGEGRSDAQTLEGKAPLAAIRAAKEKKVPSILISGSLSGDMSALNQTGATACFSIQKGPVSLEEALNRAPADLEESCYQLGRLLAQASLKK